MRSKHLFTVPVSVLLTVMFLASTTPVAEAQTFKAPAPQFSTAVAFDSIPAVVSVAPRSNLGADLPEIAKEIRAERDLATPVNKGFSGDAALQSGPALPAGALSIPSPLLTFEGISNQDNFNAYGGRVNPPDTDGDVGPNHYVEMINLLFAVYDKQGHLLAGPTKIGDLWAGFAIPDCTDPSGDPIVLYDQLADRWLLSQFTTRGLNPDGSLNGLPFYNCVAISQTGDPTGGYFRYAFITTSNSPNPRPFFPDYPKYGVWTNSYLLTSRDFGPHNNDYGISVYALEKNKMIAGDPQARVVHFFLDSGPKGVPISQIGDGLLPADIDGRAPKGDVPAPIVGTMDDGGPYGAPFDGLNIYELSVQWKSTPVASLELVEQLPVAPFDSIYPCGTVPGSLPPSARDCLPQPGVTDGSRFLDVLSYRQRPTWRLAYRKFGRHESMVTNQAVEAMPNSAGVRWYEIRRTNGQFSVFQQGTFAPGDGVHRWMGSIAMDHAGNIGLGYSVVNGIDVFPGIRYTGRLSGDPAGQMTLGEAVLQAGGGVQTTTNSRWGDYTSMNVDPADDCTFWYVNEYYTPTGQASSTAGWQTRIGSFKIPTCTSGD